MYRIMKRLPDELKNTLLSLSEQFAGTGLDVSIDDAAKMSGVPRATLYYYFAGKEDLVAFYMGDMLERVGGAVARAASGSGGVTDRLESALVATLDAMAEFPAIAVELPGAIRQAGDFKEVVSAVDRVVLTPLRELLVEGRAAGELDVPDPSTTAMALLGGVHMVAMVQITETGVVDVDATVPLLIPGLVRGLLAR